MQPRAAQSATYIGLCSTLSPWPLELAPRDQPEETSAGQKGRQGEKGGRGVCVPPTCCRCSSRLEQTKESNIGAVCAMLGSVCALLGVRLRLGSEFGALAEA